MLWGKIVGVNGLLLRFFDNGLRILGFESGTFGWVYLGGMKHCSKCVGDARGLIKMGNLSETTSNDIAYYEQVHVKKGGWTNNIIDPCVKD